MLHYLYTNHIVYYMRTALKVMPPILLCWPMTSEADVGGIAAERQTDRMQSDMEVYIKQRCGTEFLHVEKMTSIGIH